METISKKDFDIIQEIIELEERLTILKEIMQYKKFEDFWNDFLKSREEINDLDTIELDVIDEKLIIPEFIFFENKLSNLDWKKIRLFAEKFEYTINIRPADMGDRIINS